jgi:hypothetical protein
MSNSSRWLYILPGVVVVATGIGYTALHFMFRDFAGAHCTDTGQQTIASPDKKHTIMSYYRECGGPTFLFVNIATGNTNSGYEYIPIVQIDDVVPDKTSVRWDGPDQLVVTYPPTAKVEEAYAKILGVFVRLDPPLQHVSN